jgi:hypothetical protein
VPEPRGENIGQALPDYPFRFMCSRTKFSRRL